MTDGVDGLGPVQYMIVKFPGSKFTGEIVPALRELVDAGTIRIIDLAFVAKSPEGDVAIFEAAELSGDVAGAFAELQHSVMELVSDADLESVGEVIEPGSSAAVLVWEDAWAARFTAALRNADAEILDLVHVPRPVVEETIRLAKEGA